MSVIKLHCNILLDLKLIHLKIYFYILQAKDLEAGNVQNDRPVRSKVLLLRVINDRVYSFWALLYVLLMSLLIIIMMLYGESIYKFFGNAFNDEVIFLI